MSRLTVGSIEGLASEGYRITVPTGSKIVQAGAVLQVVQAVKTDTWSASVGVGSSTAVTGFTGTITPSSTSSKILVNVDIQMSHSNNPAIWVRLTRGGVAINGATGDAAGSRQRVSGLGRGDNYGNSTISFMYLDSPASTSAQTYGIICGHSNTNGADNNIMYLNRSTADTDSASFYRSASFITLMEIAG